MSTTLFIILGILIATYFSYRYYKSYSERKKVREENNRKIDVIVNNIKKEVNSKSTDSYFNGLNTHINVLLQNTLNRDKKKNDHNVLMKVDTIYCDLKRDLRIVEDFEKFKKGFSYRKRKYRSIFNKSMTILNLLNEKYGENIVNKYITNFDTDFSNMKSNEISQLNKLIKNIYSKYYKNYNIDQLRSDFRKVKNIDTNIVTILTEPKRLRDKFLHSEDNIDQMENELVNKKGSLYYKVFNMIKVNKVSKEDTDEWNTIKKNINSFKKNRLLNKDVIEINKKIVNIINDLTELNKVISQNIKVQNQLKKTEVED